jgi:hypothetical protein
MTAHTPLRCANTVMSAFPGSAGKQVVLLDSGNYPAFANYLNETWTFNGATPDWTNQSVGVLDAAGPLPGRVDAVMAYDGTGVTLYGGRGGSSADGVLQDTWTWNGTTWTKRAPATSPFGRYKAEAAYLAGTGVVMFGGRTLNDILLETWVWNGTTWALQTPAHVPPARVDHAMAAGGGIVVMFGGSGTNSQFNDTWTYNGTDWTKAAPTASPSIRSGASMAYASTGGLFVMFGGQDTKTYLDETWVYNGTTWTKVVGAGPTGRINAEMAYDAATNKVILFGGVSATLGADAANETWSFDAVGLTWTQL